VCGRRPSDAHHLCFTRERSAAASAMNLRCTVPNTSSRPPPVRRRVGVVGRTNLRSRHHRREAMGAEPKHQWSASPAQPCGHRRGGHVGSGTRRPMTSLQKLDTNRRNVSMPV
jgi:hypothetical protein